MLRVAVYEFISMKRTKRVVVRCYVVFPALLIVKMLFKKGVLEEGVKGISVDA